MAIDDQRDFRLVEGRTGLEATCHDPLPVGGVAVALLLGTYALLDVSVSVPLLVAGACGTALVYGADRAFVAAPQDEKNRPDRVDWVRTHRTWLRGEAVVLALIGGGALLFLNPLTIGGVGILGGMALLHLWPGAEAAPLERVGGKPLLLAGVWAAGAVGLPIVEAGAGWGNAALVLLGYRWLFVLPNFVLVDWGDRRGDAATGRTTWATSQNEEAVRWTATAALAGATGLLLWSGQLGVAPVLVLVELVGVGGLLVAAWTLDPRRSAHRLAMDLLVGWPVVTALGAALG